MKKLPHHGLVAIACTAGLLACGAASANTFTLTYEGPGVQNSTATFSSSGVETFTTRPVGAGQTFATTFGMSPFSGTYTGIDVVPADQYGGAGGSGRYATTATTAGYTLTLDQPVNYFGFWLSALDRGNLISFYDGATLAGQFNAGAVLGSAVVNNPAYFGNPNPPFVGANGGEPYAFVNFFSVGAGDRFDRIVFSENPVFAGYETDNHTVGLFTSIGGTPIPEPESYALLFAGFGGLVLARRRRTRSR